jgi:hypothetical protein
MVLTIPHQHAEKLLEEGGWNISSVTATAITGRKLIVDFGANALPR